MKLKLKINSCKILLYCKLGTLQPSVLSGCVLSAYAPLCDASSESVPSGNTTRPPQRPSSITPPPEFFHSTLT